MVAATDPGYEELAVQYPEETSASNEVEGVTYYPNIRLSDGISQPSEIYSSFSLTL